MESKLHYEKWQSIRHAVENLDPANVGRILRNNHETSVFFPGIGLFATEFFVCYCVNMNSKRNR